jgi:23S rRNA (cytidine1920-2'-O)/16S rRNA (cytidine1409-2'-O)-methyltransferase
VRRRLDVEMVRRGIVATRSEAAHAIRSGKVAVAGRLAAKTGTLVAPDEHIALAGPARRFVSRGGEKLDAALGRFDIEVSGRRTLDAGASTGGFTDCLLSRGASHVIAIDVGYGQLDWRLRQDPRVTVLERTNVRNLVSAELPYRPELLAADLSFISLTLAIGPLSGVAATDSEFVLLVKPQFEAGREDVGRGGVVTDPAVWRDSVRRVMESSRATGLEPAGLMASPLLGPAGNVEFLVHAVRGRGVGKPRRGLSAPDVERALEEGSALRAGGHSAEDGDRDG